MVTCPVPVTQIPPSPTATSRAKPATAGEDTPACRVAAATTPCEGRATTVTTAGSPPGSVVSACSTPLSRDTRAMTPNVVSTTPDATSTAISNTQLLCSLLPISLCLLSLIVSVSRPQGRPYSVNLTPSGVVPST